MIDTITSAYALLSEAAGHGFNAWLLYRGGCMAWEKMTRTKNARVIEERRCSTAWTIGCTTRRVS